MANPTDEIKLPPGFKPDTKSDGVALPKGFTPYLEPVKKKLSGGWWDKEYPVSSNVSSPTKSQSGLSEETIATAHKGEVESKPVVPVKPINDVGINLEHDDPFGEIIKPHVETIQKGFLSGANKPQVSESTNQQQLLKTPIKKEAELTPDQELHIASNNVDLAFKAMDKAFPDGKVAEDYLQKRFQKEGKLPDNNATVNYALAKAHELEDWNKKLTENPDLTQVAVDIARGNDENLDKQISVLEQGRFSGNNAMQQEAKKGGYYYDNMLPPEQQFKYVDELIHDPNTKLIAEKNPAVKAQLDYLLNGGIYEVFPAGAKNKILNDVSQEYEKQHGKWLFDPSSPYRDRELNEIADKLYANQPQLKKIVDENFRDNWTGKIDNPTITSKFAQGFTGAAKGQASSLIDWIGQGASRSDRVYHNLQNQFSNVSAGESGLKKDLGSAANFAGMITEMALVGKGVGATKLISPTATGMVLNASTFYDGLKDQYTMMFPDNPTKAEAGATLSTLAFTFAYKAFPSTKVAAAVSKKMQPEISEVLGSVESGAVSKEVKANFLTKLKDVTVGTLGKNFEGAAQMTAISAGQNAFDEAVGATPLAQKKYGQNPIATARNMVIGLAVPSLIQSVGNVGAAARNVNRIADYPMMHIQALDGMLRDGIITQEQYNQKASDIAFLNNTKAQIVKEGKVKESNIGRTLLEALHVKQQKEKIESSPSDFMVRGHKTNLKRGQEVLDRMLQGEDPNKILTKEDQDKINDNEDNATKLQRLSEDNDLANRKFDKQRGELDGRNPENKLKIEELETERKRVNEDFKKESERLKPKEGLTPEQELLTRALPEISGIFRGMAEEAVKDPEKAKQFLANAKNQIENEVASSTGDPSQLAKKMFGKTISDHVAPQEEAPTAQGVEGSEKDLTERKKILEIILSPTDYYGDGKKGAELSESARKNAEQELADINKKLADGGKEVPMQLSLGKEDVVNVKDDVINAAKELNQQANAKAEQILRDKANRENNERLAAESKQTTNEANTQEPVIETSPEPLKQVPSKEESGTMGQVKEGEPPTGNTTGEATEGGGENTVGVRHDSLKKIAEKMGLKQPERGTFLSSEEQTERGRKLLEGGADPQKVADEFKQEGKVSPDMISVARAHWMNLVKDAQTALDIHGKESNEFKEAKGRMQKWQDEVLKPMGTASGASFSALQGETDLDTGSFVAVSHAFENETGKAPSKEQEAKIKELTSRNQDLKKQADELEAKVVELTDKLLNSEKDKPKTIKDKTKKAADVIRKLKTARPDTFSAATPASIVWDAAIEIVAKVVEAGGSVVDAVAKGIEHIRNSEWHTQLNPEQKEKAEQDFADALLKPDEKEVEALQKKFVDKKGNKFTPDEAKEIWNYGKKNYLDKGVPYRDMIGNVSNDLGLTWRQVSEAIISPKAKRITDALWKKQADYRRSQIVTKNWIDIHNRSPLVRAWKKISGGFRGVAVFGHGGIFMGTHAGMTLFQPTTWKYTVPAFFRGWKFAYGNTAAYERAMGDLTHSPNYVLAQRAGLKNNPEVTNAEEYTNSQKYLGRLGLAGVRGFGAVKVLRQHLFDYHYDKLSSAEKADPEAVEQIARLVNNATGATNVKLPEWVNEVTFAGGMEAARWGKLTRNPARATSIALKTLFNPEKATTAERVFAKVWASRVGQQVATFAGLLAANAAAQALLNPKNPVNLTNPDKSDFLKFKFGDVTIDPSSGMLSTAKFMYGMAHDATTNQKNLNGDTRLQAMAKRTFGQARGKAAPLYSTAIDIATQTDYYGNPMPFSPDKPRAGKHTLSWGEYLWQKAPLPVAEAAHVTEQSALDNGATKLQFKDITKGILLGAFSGSTGFRVGESPKERPTPFTEEDKKRPAFKKVLEDWKMELPNTSPTSEEIIDTEKGTEKKLSDYPKETQDKYLKLHNDKLEEGLNEIFSNGVVYVQTYKDAKGESVNHVFLNPPDGDYQEKSINKLSTDEKAKVLSLAQKGATSRTKKEMFGNE